jgi:hypothetical protein
MKSERCKTLVQPSKIDYYGIHWATWPTTGIYHANSETELWIHHYKTPHKGDFQHQLRGSKEIVQDTTLRDLYAGPIQQRVLQLLVLNQTA